MTAFKISEYEKETGKRGMCYEIDGFCNRDSAYWNSDQ